MENTERCPYCGCEKSVIGVQSSYGRICADTRMLLNGQALYHIICLDCGTVIRSFVKRPKQFILKRRNNDGSGFTG